MSEATALILTYLGMTALTVVTCVVLGAFQASGTAWGLALGLLAGLGGFLLSLVVMHYTPPDRRPR